MTLRYMYCPYCKEELDADVIEAGEFSGDTYVDKLKGTCPQCEKNFFWNEVFTFHHVWGFEEETATNNIFERMVSIMEDNDEQDRVSESE